MECSHCGKFINYDPAYSRITDEPICTECGRNEAMFRMERSTTIDGCSQGKTRLEYFNKYGSLEGFDDD